MTLQQLGYAQPVMTSADDAVRLAITLSSGNGSPGNQHAQPNTGDAVGELAHAGREALQEARGKLVQRIYLRSDDYEATAALSLVNKALASLGWEDPYIWKHRRKP